MNEMVSISREELERLRAAEKLIMQRLAAETISDPVLRMTEKAKCRMNGLEWAKIYWNGVL